jgi:hypothetical protein
MHAQRISLGKVLVLGESNEASYVRYAANDLGTYLTEIIGKPVKVSTSADEVRKAKSVIAVGEKWRWRRLLNQRSLANWATRNLRSVIRQGEDAYYSPDNRSTTTNLCD